MVLPCRETKGASSKMGVHSFLACSCCGLSLAIGTGVDSSLIMIALDSKSDFWRGSDCHVYVSIDLINVSAISQIFT